MKVNIDQTVQVTDEQRVRIANVLDGKVSKRQATRDEMKQYIWDEGSGWAVVLNDSYADLTGEDPEEDLIGGDENEDLIGGDDLEGLI